MNYVSLHVGLDLFCLLMESLQRILGKKFQKKVVKLLERILFEFFRNLQILGSKVIVGK